MTRRRLVVAAAALVAITAATASGATTAAWTDPALFEVVASTGTWDGGETPAGPLEPGEDTTEIGPEAWAIGDDNSAGYCVTFTVSSTSSTPVAWSVIWHLDEAPVWSNSAATIYSPGPTGAIVTQDASTATISGVSTGGEFHPEHNNALLDAAHSPLTVTLCVSQASIPPPADPSWYSVTQQPSGTWTRTEACVTLTATGNRDLATNPYYFGWQAVLDLSEPIAYVQSQGAAPNFVRFTPDPSNAFHFSIDPTTIAPPASSYQITSGQLDAIRGDQSVTILACIDAS